MTSPDAAADHAENVRTGCALISALYSAGLRNFVLVGSIDEYGDNLGALHEDLPPVGKLTAYARAKRELCEFGFEEAAKHASSFTHIRLSNVYGAGQRPGSLINKLYAASMGSGLVDLGPCNNIRDYIHVDDAAEGIGRIAAACDGEIVNLGSGRPVKIRDFVLQFWAALGCDPGRLSFQSHPRVKPCSWLDLNRLEERTGWLPKTSMQDGISKTINDLRAALRPASDVKQ